MPLNHSAFRWSRLLQVGSHAYMQVQLVGPAGQLGTVRGALVDTGASHSMFGTLMALQAGYNLARLGTVGITLANGTTARVQVINNASLLIEGHAVTMRRLLLRAANGTDLLCPEDLLSATHFGCDPHCILFD